MTAGFYVVRAYAELRTFAQHHLVFWALELVAGTPPRKGPERDAGRREQKQEQKRAQLNRRLHETSGVTTGM
jgi:hypothetical protein